MSNIYALRIENQVAKDGQQMIKDRIHAYHEHQTAQKKVISRIVGAYYGRSYTDFGLSFSMLPPEEQWITATYFMDEYDLATVAEGSLSKESWIKDLTDTIQEKINDEVDYRDNVGRHENGLVSFVERINGEMRWVRV